MTQNFNPFLHFTFPELEEAYVLFTIMEDTEAVAWVEDAFCLKAKLEVDLSN